MRPEAGPPRRGRGARLPAAVGGVGRLAEGACPGGGGGAILAKGGSGSADRGGGGARSGGRRLPARRPRSGAERRMQQPQPQGQQQPGPGQQLGVQGAAPGAGGGPGGGPGPGPCLRRELKLLESIFHRGHERFRIASACLDELSCEFLLAGAGGAGAGAAPGPHLPSRGSVPGDPVRIHCNITVRTFSFAPRWGSLVWCSKSHHTTLLLSKDPEAGVPSWGSAPSLQTTLVSVVQLEVLWCSHSLYC